jgi:AsmA protein
VEVRVDGKDGLVDVDPLSARLYEGSLQGKARLDARTDMPKTTLEQSLTGVQVGPLLKDLAGNDTLTGRTELSSDLSMSGLDPEAIKKSLDGTLRFAFTDGSVKGINIPRLIRQARARLEGETLPPEKEVLRTDFSELTGSARITDGLVQNDDLLLKSPLLRVEGEGQASLPKETIDYRLTTTIVGTLTGQGGEEIQELEGVPIPVQIGGTFQKPSFKLDLAKVLETRAAEEVKKRAREEVEKKVQEELGDKLKEGVGGQAEEAIRGLFR